VREVLSVNGALASRTTRGGTAPSALQTQISELQNELSENTKEFTDAAKAFHGMMES